MPQVTCPKCGTTINLENRKAIDFDLIASATKNRPRTFTELLHLTKLSRKTLSLRLRELCSNGTLVKIDGLYEMSDGSGHGFKSKHSVEGFSKMVGNRSMRIGLMLVAFLLSSSVSGYVLAMFVMPPRQPETAKPIGEFTLALDIGHIEDLYAWQAVITFDPDELNVLKTVSSAFFELEYPFFLNATDVESGMLVLGGTLHGATAGKTGEGTLALVEFGYFVQDYKAPKLQAQQTYLLNSGGSVMSADSLAELSLRVVK
jgi:hypothetical protein